MASIGIIKAESVAAKSNVQLKMQAFLVWSSTLRE